MSGSIFVVIIIVVVLLCIKKIRDCWVFHLIVNIIFYSLNIYLWIEISKPQVAVHNVDRGFGVAIFILLTTPFYLILNSYFIYYGYKNKLSKVMYINILALILCIINLTYLYYKTGGFS